MIDAGAWLLETARGLTLARCAALSDVPGVVHAFSTRRGPGGVDLDLGSRGGTIDGVDSFSRAAGLGSGRPRLARQVHGARAVVVDGEAEAGEADALVSLAGNASNAVAVRVADCVPILLVDERGQGLAAVHAGWRGTAAGISAATVGLLGRLGLDAGRIRAAIGPAIGPCCYPVGEQVVEAVVAAGGVRADAVLEHGPDGRPRIDLRAANRLQLLEAGLAEGAIHTAPWCTSCEKRLFFSYRRDAERSGRMMALVGWAGAAAPVP